MTFGTEENTASRSHYDPQEMVEDINYEIGARVECEGHRGTVRYIGTVGDTKGTWLGIDWDDPSRGKHNGTYQGTTFFEARNSTSGSFVRPGKAKLGVTISKAIKDRYGLIDDDLAGIDRASLTSLKKEMKAPFVEMVGFSKVNRKQSKFDQLTTVFLREQCISTAGEPGELGELCPNLRELDISKNLINSWNVVADICRELPKLQRLDVSDNVLPVEEDSTSITIDETFPNIRYLTMSRMNYNWTKVQRCTVLFPSLQELSISFNIVKRLEEPSGDFHLNGITSLTLEGNFLQSWDEVLKLGALPRLENLNLNSNGISIVRFPCEKTTGKTHMFAGLRQLHLSHNSIAEWRSISELEKLSNLEDLKFRDNPVLKEVSCETARQLIIAKIAKLKFLNGVEIDATERKGAEYDYLKLFGPQWLQSASENGSTETTERRKQFVENHPRYPVLVEKYGGPEVVAPKANITLVSDVIKVEFCCPNDPSQTKTITRKLLKDMDVQKVTGLAQRIFRTGGKIPKLSFVRRDISKDEIPLDKPLQLLSYYSIQNGDRILVRW
ncbi:tubulin-specific chaperone E [Venturia canescens]|uniref:tubulin-specific chaperone E n=1 Tax=Venturia canescens TaxID=32260 RepID=UPI001C9C6F36|nr:tubulin-specific chaperone E [Venturia canescens]